MKPLIVVVILFVLVGCSKNDDINKTVMEQQRLNLDTLKQNQETLDKIRAREKELSQLEKKNEATLKEIESKRTQLAERETYLNSKANAIKSEIAKNQTVLDEQKETLQEIKKQNDITTRLAQLAQTRIPFAERLANVATKAMPRSSKKEGVASVSAYYNECLSVIKNSGVMEIESDAVFEEKAKGVMTRYVRRYTNPNYDWDTIKDNIDASRIINDMRMNDTEEEHAKKQLHLK